MITHFILAYIAGLITLLSPCVLPLLPIILFGALGQHKHGAISLSMGLVISFTLFGFLLATVGHSVGLSQDLLRQIAGSILVIFGIILNLEPVYRKFSAGASQLTSGFSSYITKFHFQGLWGQFALGSVLGLVWAPCIGPTLGSAISLAAQGKELTTSFLIMLIFSLGTVTPLILLSRLSREKVLEWKTTLGDSSRYLKPVMALIFIGVGFLFLTGYIFVIEEAVLNALPSRFIQFITQI